MKANSLNKIFTLNLCYVLDIDICRVNMDKFCHIFKQCEHVSFTDKMVKPISKHIIRTMLTDVKIDSDSIWRLFPSAVEYIHWSRKSISTQDLDGQEREYSIHSFNLLSFYH